MENLFVCSGEEERKVHSHKLKGGIGFLEINIFCILLGRQKPRSRERQRERRQGKGRGERGGVMVII